MQQATFEKTEMTLGSLIKDYVYYNLWANERLIDWLKTKPVALMDSMVPSSYSSIKCTLVHIWDCQKWWLGVLQLLQPEMKYGQVYKGSIEEVFDGLVIQSEEIVSYVNALDEEELEESCPFAIPTVGDFNQRRLEILQHCMNHSTYHRGQIVTIGRNVGLTDAPMTDYMFYLLMVKR